MRIALSEAISAIQTGHVIAVPTETVYGLAASLNHPSAIERIFALKGRPLNNPLIIHVSDKQNIYPYITDTPPHFEALTEAFWPGSLTCILPINSKVPPLACAGLPTAGFRIPSLEITRHLLRAAGPLVMPSANLSGRPSSTHPEHVEEDFGIDFPVLDGGICTKGVESTILLYQENEWVVIRLGALAPERFIPVLGYLPRVIQKTSSTHPLCPGQLFRHYAPKAHLFLGDPQSLLKTHTILGFKERQYPSGKRLLILGSLANAEGVAENLYQTLRQIDQEGIKEAWVDMDFPREGLWQTIAERLFRAGEK